MMSSSRVVTAASRRPSSSTRRDTVSLACATARSRICDSISARILKVISSSPGPCVSASSPRNDLVKRSSIFALSAGSLNLRRMSAVSGCATWTLSSSLVSSSRVTRPSPVWMPKCRRQRLAHVVGVVIALVADRLVDLDGVDEAHAAAKIEARGDGEVDAVGQVAGNGDLPAAHVVHRRPEGDARGQEHGHHEARLEPPRAIHQRNQPEGGPHQDESAGEESPEVVEVKEERAGAGRDGHEQQARRGGWGWSPPTRRSRPSRRWRRGWEAGPRA